MQSSLTNFWHSAAQPLVVVALSTAAFSASAQDAERVLQWNIRGQVTSTQGDDVINSYVSRGDSFSDFGWKH